MSSDAPAPPAKKASSGSLYILISLALTLAFAAYVLMTWVKLLHNTSWCYATANGVIDYVHHHDSVMPQSWSEYTAWQSQQPGHPAPLDPAQLDRTFALPWGQHITRETPPPLFIVKDPDLKHLEPALNKKVTDACLGSLDDSRAKPASTSGP